MLIRFGVILLVLSWIFAQGQGLRVENAWIRLVPGKTTAAYMVLVNTGARPIRVLGVGSPIAARGELHQTQFVDPNDPLGMDHSHTPEMKGLEVTGMRPLKELLVPARGRLELKPGGIHLMLIDLRQPLRQGQQVRLTLRLEGGGEPSMWMQLFEHNSVAYQGPRHIGKIRSEPCNLPENRDYFIPNI